VHPKKKEKTFEEKQLKTLCAQKKRTGSLVGGKVCSALQKRREASIMFGFLGGKGKASAEMPETQFLFGGRRVLFYLRAERRRRVLSAQKKRENRV